MKNCGSVKLNQDCFWYQQEDGGQRLVDGGDFFFCEADHLQREQHRLVARSVVVRSLKNQDKVCFSLAFRRLKSVGKRRTVAVAPSLV